MVGEIGRGDRLVGAHHLRRRQVATAGEHRQPLEDALLVVEEQLVAPVDDGAQRLLAGQRGARPTGEQAEPIVEPGGDLGDRERPGAGGRQLDGERQTVEPGADVGDRRSWSSSESSSGAPAALARATKRRTASSAASGGTGQMVSPPTRSPSRLVARSRRPGQRRSRSSATSAAVVITCSQLSSTISRSRSPISSASRFGSGRSRAAAIAARTPAGSPTGASSTRQPPKLRSSADRRAPTSRASRVLPTPPGPTRVTNRSSASRRGEVAPLGVAPDQRGQRLGDGRAGLAPRRPGPRPATGGGSSDRSWARIADSNWRSSWPGFEPELLAQEVTTLLEDPEGVGLPAGAVQRQHQQPAEPLAQRMGGDELLELDDGTPGDDRARARCRAAPRSRRAADSDNRVMAAAAKSS